MKKFFAFLIPALVFAAPGFSQQLAPQTNSYSQPPVGVTPAAYTGVNPTTPAAPPNQQVYKGAPNYDRFLDNPEDNEPLTLEEIQNIEKENNLEEGESALPFDIRAEAIKEAAISYGARAGLAWRTREIRKELEVRARYLDKVYNFKTLLIPAPSGMMIEPPVITESINAMLIEGDGQQAAVSDRIYNIVNNAKIVSTSRTWRTYLEREWGKVDPPPDILRPEDEKERAIWIELTEKGWQEGIRQANEIFQDDLNVLMMDFQGMVRYRVLLSQGMISPPYALQVDRGVTGGGNEMRVGDRAVQITGVPELITGSDQWQPANR